MASLGQNDEIADLLEREQKKAKEGLRLKRIGDYNNPNVKTEVTDDVKVKMDGRRFFSAILIALQQERPSREPQTSPIVFLLQLQERFSPNLFPLRSFGAKDRYKDEREENNQRRARRNQAEDFF